MDVHAEETPPSTPFVECIQAATRTRHCRFRGYQNAPTVRQGYKRATVVTARKMLRVIYAVLRCTNPYRHPETNYEALMVRRNALRWIRMRRNTASIPRPVR